MKKTLLYSSLLALAIVGGGKSAQAQALDRTDWTIQVSSECNDDGTNGYKAMLTDGDVNTYWHSNWRGGDGTGDGGVLPEWIYIDLGESEEFSTLAYLPRPNLANGTCTDYKVWVSEDEIQCATREEVEALNDPTLQGFIDYDDAINGVSENRLITAMEEGTNQEKTLRGRYVLFVITKSSGKKFGVGEEGQWGSCCEFNIFPTRVAADQYSAKALQAQLKTHVEQTLVSYEGNGVGYIPADSENYTALKSLIADSDPTSPFEMMDAYHKAIPQNLVLMPQGGQYYRIVNKKSTTNDSPDMLTVKDGKAFCSESVTNDAGKVWRLFAAPQAGSFSLYNPQTKQYLDKTATGSGAQTGMVDAAQVYRVTLTAPGTFELRDDICGFALQTENHYLNGYNVNADWEFQVAQTLDVDLNEAAEGHFATAYLPFPVTQGEGAALYTGELTADADAVVLKAVGDATVLAETGLLLRGDGAAAKLNITPVQKEGEIEPISDNVLKGTLAPVALSEDNRADYLILSTNASNAIGFYQPAATATELLANKAYIAVDDLAVTAGKLSLVFDGEATGIATVTPNAQGAAAVYDLSGRRVQNPARGIYLVGGRKQFVR